MQHIHIRPLVVTAALVTALLGSSLARPIDDLPGTSSEWTSALSQYVYAGQPVTQAQGLNSRLASYLKSLGMVKLWQVSSGGRVQEGWYSATQQVTVVTSAAAQDTASLSVQVMDGRVTPEAALAVSGK